MNDLDRNLFKKEILTNKTTKKNNTIICVL